VYGSKLARIVYAARNDDSAASAIDCIPIPSMQMKQLSKNGVEIVGDVLRDESLKLFTIWSVAHRFDGTGNGARSTEY